MSAKIEFHGSDIEKVCEIYGLRREDIIMFGANVNPLGLSEHVKEQLAGRLDILSSYPDRNYTSLCSTISEYCNIPAEFILPGNGSSELIALLIQERNPKHTLILGSTYSEYARELSFSGSTQEYYHLREEDNFVLNVDDLCHTLEGKYDFLILCNPNNPTSSAIKVNDLRRIVSFCNERNIFVMIDETYVEFAPDINEITAISLTREFQNLMVLRGVSKFYAAPGMRLGYGITGNLEFLKKMKEKQVPWSLNSLGALAGELMLQDKTYIRQTRRPHPLRTHPPASSIRGNPHLQNLPYLRQLPPPENPEARPDLPGHLRHLHPPGPHDPRLHLLRMLGRRIHPLLHHAPPGQHPAPPCTDIIINLTPTKYFPPRVPLEQKKPETPFPKFLVFFISF